MRPPALEAASAWDAGPGHRDVELNVSVFRNQPNLRSSIGHKKACRLRRADAQPPANVRRLSNSRPVATGPQVEFLTKSAPVANHRRRTSTNPSIPRSCSGAPVPLAYADPSRRLGGPDSRDPPTPPKARSPGTTLARRKTRSVSRNEACIVISPGTVRHPARIKRAMTHAGIEQVENQYESRKTVVRYKARNLLSAGAGRSPVLTRW